MSKAVVPRVFVGLSGGVDSSVAALRLIQAGYEVVGVFIKVWHPSWLVCNWEAERLDAMRVAAHLGIPFLTCDAEKAYRDGVAQYFISEYQAGRTPNPDVMCNKHVKFGAFMDFAKSYGADYIATGHYARKITTTTGSELHRGIDENKDQSYFLWSLTKEQLADTLLPIGDTVKSRIRDEATAAKIPTAAKKDSQGICFLGHIDIQEFLSHYTTLSPGVVVDENQRKIGTHSGALIYTPGQRHGLSITVASTEREPYYVVAKDLETNTIIASTTKPVLAANTSYTLSSVCLRESILDGDICEAQTRYRQTPSMVTLSKVTENSITAAPLHEAEVATSGQSCVLYRGTHCIGGGIIL